MTILLAASLMLFQLLGCVAAHQISSKHIAGRSLAQ